MIERPRVWWSVASEKLWGDGDTYVRVDADRLPALGALDGSFAWLVEPHAAIDPMDRAKLRDAAAVPTRLELLAAQLAPIGLTLPDVLVRFLTSPDLPTRFPSASMCYFDLASRAISIPGHDGPERLVRFLVDQQSTLIWYVLLEPGGQHRVACATPSWREDAKTAKTLEDAMEPYDLAICADDVEEMLKRFWLENTLWFALHVGHPAIEGELGTYLDAVIRTRTT